MFSFSLNVWQEKNNNNKNNNNNITLFWLCYVSGYIEKKCFVWWLNSCILYAVWWQTCTICLNCNWIFKCVHEWHKVLFDTYYLEPYILSMCTTCILYLSCTYLSVMWSDIPWLVACISVFVHVFVLVVVVVNNLFKCLLSFGSVFVLIARVYLRFLKIIEYVECLSNMIVRRNYQAWNFSTWLCLNKVYYYQFKCLWCDLIKISFRQHSECTDTVCKIYFTTKIQYARTQRHVFNEIFTNLWNNVSVIINNRSVKP